MNEDKQLENRYKQNSTENAKLGNEHYTKLSSESIKTLEDAIRRMHAEIDFASRSFNANAESSSNSLRATIDLLNESLKGSNSNLEKYAKVVENLDSQTNTLSLLPKKVEERIETLPNNIKNTVIDNIPAIGQQLANAQKNLANEVQTSMNEYTNDLLMDII